MVEFHHISLPTLQGNRSKGRHKVLLSKFDAGFDSLRRGSVGQLCRKICGFIKKSITKNLKASNEPLVLWCYCAKRCSKIINATACNNYHLKGQTPHTLTNVQPTHISDIYYFGWYLWWYYQDPAAKYPNRSYRLGRVLGPVDHYGTDMSQWVINENGSVLTWQTFRYLNVSEITIDTEEQKRKDVDSKIKLKLGYFLYSQWSYWGAWDVLRWY